MYETPTARAHYEDIQRRQRIAAERAAAKAPTDEQIREYLERESKSVEQEARERKNEEIAAQWVTMHPEYKATRGSGALMEEYLAARGLTFTHDNLTTAFQYLASKGLVETNSQEVQAKVRQAAQTAEMQRRAQALDARRRNHSPEEMYDMPLDQLEELARGVRD